jgi:Spy/CpxP family protein refolding chaperone
MSISLVALVATLAGCGVEGGGAEAESAQSAVTTPATDVAPANVADRGPRGGHRPGGPDFLLMAALHEDIGLTAAQKTTLEGLLPKRDGMREERPAPDKARTVALAAAIRSGKVDSLPAMGPPAQDDAAHAARQAEAVKRLDTLYATLTPEQRTALVAAMAKHEGPEHGKRPDGAKRPDGDKAPREGKEMHGPMGGLLAGINLTDAQKDQIKAKLDANRPAKPTEAQRAEFEKKHEAMKAEHQARLQTFASGSFDAKTFLTPPAKPEGEMANGHDPMQGELAAIVSVLDASQREQLATKIEQGPPAR